MAPPAPPGPWVPPPQCPRAAPPPARYGSSRGPPELTRRPHGALADRLTKVRPLARARPLNESAPSREGALPASSGLFRLLRRRLAGPAGLARSLSCLGDVAGEVLDRDPHLLEGRRGLLPQSDVRAVDEDVVDERADYGA